MSNKKYTKKIKLSRFEQLLYTLAGIFLLVVLPVGIVFSQATLSKISYDVEKKQKEITAQEKTNEGLAMTIDELASLTKIQEVAEEQGLRYNNDNIKTISNNGSD